MDILTSNLQNVLKGFSKTPLEAFWNFASISISICFCQAQHPWQTFKSYPERDTFSDRVTSLPLCCQLMAKAAVAQPSPSPLPTKILVTQVEQKAKGKKKAPAKATKAAAKVTKVVHAGNEEASDVEIVEDDIKCVSYILATSMSLVLL